MDYDLIVIGAGPGGYVAAIRAAQLGGKVAVVEERQLGGTCLNRGCIPTKALIESVHVLKLAQKSAEYGVTCGEVAPDYARMAARKDEVIEKLRGGIGMLLKKNKIEIITGRGKLADKNTVEVTTDGATTSVTAKNIIIATGSEPLKIPGFPFDGKRVITSDDALGWTEIPKSIIIVGGGYIGAEWVSIFRGLGVEVTVVEMMDQLLPRSDTDLAKELFKAFKKAKTKIFLKTKVEGVSVTDESVTCKLSSGKEITADVVMVSVGRSINSTSLGLEEVGVELDRAAIAVDDHCRTSVPNIYAIGDVTAKLMLAHVASRQGIVAAECAMGHEATADLSVVPACVFTHPEIGSVGKSAAECEAEGIDFKESKFNFMGLGKAQAIGDTAGWAKIIAEKETGVILGVHIIGPHASDLISEAGLAMSMEATVEEIAHAIHAHPTLPEALSESAEVWLGRPIHS
jgi:dihydrolipoyl dehydrogenase